MSVVRRRSWAPGAARPWSVSTWRPARAWPHGRRRPRPGTGEATSPATCPTGMRPPTTRPSPNGLRKERASRSSLATARFPSGGKPPAMPSMTSARGSSIHPRAGTGRPSWRMRGGGQQWCQCLLHLRLLLQAHRPRRQPLLRHRGHVHARLLPGGPRAGPCGRILQLPRPFGTGPLRLHERRVPDGSRARGTGFADYPIDRCAYSGCGAGRYATARATAAQPA